jgi:hypothetical protein
LGVGEGNNSCCHSRGEHDCVDVGRGYANIGVGRRRADIDASYNKIEGSIFAEKKKDRSLVETEAK